MAKYAAWADVKVWIDKDPNMNQVTGPDAATLQGFEDAQEILFENEVRGFLAVPITLSASPEAFNQAKAICSMRGAAQAIRYYRQTEGDPEGMWFANWLDKKADELVAQLKSAATQPADIVVSENPVETLPVFGGLPATADYERGQRW